MKLTSILLNGEKKPACLEDGEVYVLKTSLTLEDVIRQETAAGWKMLKKKRSTNLFMPT